MRRCFGFRVLGFALAVLLASTAQADRRRGLLGNVPAAGGGGGGGGTTWVTGQTLNTPGSSFTLGIGVKLTTGGSAVTVTHLGRWVIAGNSQTHVVRIRDAAGTDLGNVTVNCSGAPAGAFTYAALGTPVVLSAGTDYYIYSDETNGGDQWYFIGTMVTTTSAASVVSGSYWDGSHNATTAGECWGPVSFKYSAP